MASVLPKNWQESGIAEYLDDPMSPEALADPRKGYLELGEFAALDCVDPATHPRLVPNVAGYATDAYELKMPHRPPELPVGKPETIYRVHELLLNAVQSIIGEKRFGRSRIEFGHRYGSVEEGGSQVALRPHVDGVANDYYRQDLKLVGLLMSHQPTWIFQGEYKPDAIDRETGRLISLFNMGRRFDRQAVPTDTLVLMSANMLHEPSRATEPIPERYFGRWHIRF